MTLDDIDQKMRECLRGQDHPFYWGSRLRDAEVGKGYRKGALEEVLIDWISGARPLPPYRSDLRLGRIRAYLVRWLGHCSPLLLSKGKWRQLFESNEEGFDLLRTWISRRNDDLAMSQWILEELEYLAKNAKSDAVRENASLLVGVQKTIVRGQRGKCEITLFLHGSDLRGVGTGFGDRDHFAKNAKELGFVFETQGVPNRKQLLEALSWLCGMDASEVSALVETLQTGTVCCRTPVLVQKLERHLVLGEGPERTVLFAHLPGKWALYMVKAIDENTELKVFF